MHTPKLTVNLSCKMDFLFVCDLWGPVTYRPNVLLKYYKGEMWIHGNRAERETMTQGNAGGRGKMVGWKREMSIPFIEEGRQTSFIGGSVSPEWCHRGKHRINHLSLTHLLSSSVCLPSSWLSQYLSRCVFSLSLSPFLLSLSLPVFFVSITCVRGDHCPVSQSN